MREGSTPDKIILDQQIEMGEAQDSLYSLGPEHRDLSETFDDDAPKEIDHEVATLVARGMNKDLANPNLDPAYRLRLERIIADFEKLGITALWPPPETTQPVIALGPIDQNHPSSSS